ncbi:hypothetical protein [Paraclostridium bifermentans]|uniref:hypothetical protein n=1 Tax=Paraclostridium bifermentans TaxID=1490 RepID=UPI001FF543C4|nr:hypothetical protein [Paraclostridium bifermentans]UOW69068.1 hypothetical protein MTR78_06455 [Paraclostridium bifermentans]
MSNVDKEKIILKLSEEMDLLINSMQTMLKDEWDRVKDEYENGRLRYTNIRNTNNSCNEEIESNNIFMANLL